MYERTRFGGIDITVTSLPVGFVPKLVSPCFHRPCPSSSRPISTSSRDGAGKVVSFRQVFDLGEYINIGEPDFEQQDTYESNYASKDLKLKLMSLMIIPNHCSKDSAGKVGPHYQSCKS